jgi:hypothetical protein
MKKAGKNRRGHTLYTKIKGQKIINFAVIVSLLMIIYIAMASASTTIIIATKPLPSDIVFSEAKEYGVPIGENFPSKHLPVISDWLNGTGINDADVETCFIDKNIENDELEVMMILEDKRLTLSSLSVDSNCSFLDISNYRILQGFNDSLVSIVNTTSNNRKTLQGFNDSLGSFEKETSRTLENFQKTSEDLQKASKEIQDIAKELEIQIGNTKIQIGNTNTLQGAILFTLIGGIIALIFFIVGRPDTRKRRR